MEKEEKNLEGLLKSFGGILLNLGITKNLYYRIRLPQQEIEIIFSIDEEGKDDIYNLRRYLVEKVEQQFPSVNFNFDILKKEVKIRIIPGTEISDKSDDKDNRLSSDNKNNKQHENVMHYLLDELNHYTP